MRALWIAAAIACAACHAPPPAPPRTIRFESTVHSERLPNGLRVLVLEDRGTNLVEIGIRVAAGSASDPDGQTGLAHLVEHLMFEVRRDGRPLAAQLSALAIGFNAHTTWEATHYATTARADQLPQILALEAQRFAATCGDIPPGTFEREREVVRNELRLRTSLPLEGMTSLVDAIYPVGHPYRRSVGGLDTDLAALELGDVCGFLARHYTPDRIVVVISGNVRPRAALTLVERTFGSLAARRPAAPARFPGLRTARVEIESDLDDEPGLVVAWRMPPRYTARYVLAQLALALVQMRLPGSDRIVLGGDEQPIAVFRLRAGDAEEMLEKVDDAIARVVERLDDRELEALINRRARALLSDFDQLGSRVERLAESFQAGEGDHIFVFQLQLLNRATRDSIKNAADEVFGGPRVVVETHPGVRRVERRPWASLSYAGRSHDDAWTAPVDPAEATRPLEVPIAPGRLSQATEYTHESGMRVVLLQTPAVPLLHARLLFAGGSADDPPNRQGLAEVTAEALTFKGISAHAGTTPAYVALRWFGDDLDRDVGTDQTVFEVRGLSSHLDAMIAGLASLVIDGEYRDDVMERRLRDRSKDRKKKESPGLRRLRRWVDVRIRFERELLAAIYGPTHPYARVRELDSTYHGITADDVEALRRERFTARNAVLVVTGQFDPDLVREHIDHWFDDMPTGRPARRLRPPASPRRPPGGVIAVETAPDDVTTTLHVAFGTEADPRARAARLVAVRILNERAARIRTQLGASYAVRATYHENRGPGMIKVEAEVDAARVEEALRALVAEIGLVRAGGAEIDEAFVRARREVLHHALAEDSGAGSAGDRIAALAARGLPLRTYTELARQVMRLTIADVMPIFTRDLAPDKAVIAVLGPPASVAAARRALAPTAPP